MGLKADVPNKEFTPPTKADLIQCKHDFDSAVAGPAWRRAGQPSIKSQFFLQVRKIGFQLADATLEI